MMNEKTPGNLFDDTISSSNLFGKKPMDCSRTKFCLLGSNTILQSSVLETTSNVCRCKEFSRIKSVYHLDIYIW